MTVERSGGGGQWLGALLVGGGLVVGALALGAGEARAQQADLPVEAIEQIVRDYLMREPEVIMEALEELQRQREMMADAEQRERLAAEGEALLLDPRDPVLGNPDGDVTLVEFFDYRCGYCRAMVEPMQTLLDEDPDLRIVMKEFPILGPESLLASKAALAAHVQGQYEAMHWALMGKNRVDEAAIRTVASELGLDVERLLADMESDEVADHIQDNVLLAQGLGINGTPSFVIGETLLPGAVPLERITDLVAQERVAGG